VPVRFGEEISSAAACAKAAMTEPGGGIIGVERWSAPDGPGGLSEALFYFASKIARWLPNRKAKKH